jgi:hypothetical protein
MHGDVAFAISLQMNDEEKKFVELRNIYSSYRVLFENQATGYLVYR